jgi:pteridine reductase
MTTARKVALVTGAATRVGSAIAVALAEADHDVLVHYHQNADGAQRTKGLIHAAGGRCEVFSADLSKPTQARQLVDDAIQTMGRLDTLVSSAANFERLPFDDVDGDAWSRAMDLNVTASFHLAHQASAELRQRQGSIVFITCSSVTTPMRNYLPYVVSKGALHQLMRVLSLELAPEVRVNAVAPGTVLPPESMTEAQLNRLRSRIPLARFGSAEEIASAVVFLTRSDFVTGQQLTIDGGRSLAAIESFE